ncbi:unnamed protein product, partial [Phaedon cochleariae]
EFAVDVLFFKVWNKSRDLKTIVKLEESEDNLLNKLIGKASEKLYLNGIKLVLESDGTTIDEDEILRVIKSDVFILLQPKEEWEPPQPNTSTSTSIGEVIEYDYQIRQLNRDYNAFTWDNFEINWEQFPSYVLRACTKGKREKQVITHIIHSIVNKMREIKTHIPTYAFKVVSRKLIEKYPNMFLDVDEDGVVIADGCHSVYKKLQDRNNYLNRPYKRKPSHKRNNSRDHSNRLGTRSDCMFLTPDNADAATEATEDYNDEDDAFYENLERTFTGQRNFIKSNPTYDEIKKQWPVLLNGRAIIWHFNKLTNLNLYRMGEKVVERYQKFLKLAYSSKIDVASEEELLQIVKILSVYFKEDLNCFYAESKTLPKEEAIEGVYPYIIAVPEIIKPYQCTKCDKSYTTRSAANYHEYYRCNKPPQFKCHHCERKFRHGISLKDHLFVLHGEKVGRLEMRKIGRTRKT